MSADDIHLEKLLDAYFEGEMDQEAKRELDQLLSGSSHARRLFWERAELEGALEAWAEDSRGELLLRHGEESARRSTRRRVLPWAAAAAVALGAGVVFHNQRGNEGVAGGPETDPAVPTYPESHNRIGYQPVAYLSRVSEVSGSSVLVQGQSLSSGVEVSIPAGILEIDFFSGARVSIQGPARFLPESDMRLSVSEGRVQVDVPDSAKGFVLELPDGTVTDFGTSFEAAVSDSRTSRLQVRDGEIELAEGTGDGSVRRMFEGDAVTLAEEGGLKPISFVDLSVKTTLESRKAEDNRRRAAEWDAVSAGLADDESMLVHFRFLPEEEDGREIVNRARHPNAPATGTVIAADWGRGRWPGKKALSFHGYADRVRVDIPGEYPQATFLAWVRVDNLPLRYNGLFLSEANIEGEAHWQFSREGEFMFGIRPKGTANRIVKFHRAFSGPELVPGIYGGWHLIATSYDSASREAVHYVDGAEVARLPIEDSVPLRFGRATLGNFFDEHAEEHEEVPGLGRSWSFRNWSGAVDEFMLFARALSPDEVAEIHRAGDPE